MLWRAEIVENSISVIRDYLVLIGYRVDKTKPAGRMLAQTIVAAMLALGEPDVRRWDETAYHALIRGENPWGLRRVELKRKAPQLRAFSGIRIASRPWRPKRTVHYVGVAASHFEGRLALTVSRVATFHSFVVTGPRR